MLKSRSEFQGREEMCYSGPADKAKLVVAVEFVLDTMSLRRRLQLSSKYLYQYAGFYSGLVKYP